MSFIKELSIYSSLFYHCIHLLKSLGPFYCRMSCIMDQFSSVQLLIPVQLFATAWTAACQASLSILNSQSLLKLMAIESVMPSSHFILCHPLLLLPSSFPSIRVFSNELIVPIRWPKYGNFIFSINPSNEYSRLISFTIDWLDLLAVQGTLKSLLQTSPQCKSITSLVLSFLYSSTFTSIHYYWKIHSFEYMDLVDKVCLCFLIHCLGLS